MRYKLIFTTVIATLALLGLSACSNNQASEKSFNSADVSFAQDLIPHHRQATEMAELAADRTTNSRVSALAAKIIAAQQPEIEAMSGWLKSWDKKVSDDSSMGGMDHGSSGMPGMMSMDEMSSLKGSSAGQFDQMFLTMMISHHKGAIEMAATEEADGTYLPALKLAKKIQTDQAAEIVTMEALLTS